MSCIKSINFFILIILIISLSILLNEGWANTIKLIPQVTMKHEYTDNVNFGSANEEGDWIFTLSPCIKLKHNTLKNELNAEAEISFLEYTKKDELDTVNQKYKLFYDFQGTELFNINFLSSFIRDTTLDSEIEESGLVFRRQGRKKHNIKPIFSWVFTEKTSLDFSYDNTKVWYDCQQDYSNFQIQDTMVQVLHKMKDARKVLLWQIGYSRYNFEYNLDRSDTDYTDSYRSLLGAEYEYSQIFKITAQTGLRYTRMRFLNGTRGDIKRKGFGLLGFTSEYPGGLITLTFSRDIVSSGLYGEIIEQNKVILDAHQRINKFLTGDFKARWNDSKSESDFWDTDSDYYYLSSSLSYRLMRQASISLRYIHDEIYNHQKIINDQETDRKQKRNTIYLQLRIFWEQK